MRIVLIAAGLAALVCAGCTKTGDTAEAGTVPAATERLDPGAVDGQTLDQVLEKTMNRFAKIDLNGDGKLTPDELNAATQGGDKTDPTGQRSRQGLSIRAIAHADANGDGVVTRQEVEAQTRAQFKKLDTNGDGRLSNAELAAEH